MTICYHRLKTDEYFPLQDISIQPIIVSVAPMEGMLFLAAIALCPDMDSAGRFCPGGNSTTIIDAYRKNDAVLCRRYTVRQTWLLEAIRECLDL